MAVGAVCKSSRLWQYPDKIILEPLIPEVDGCLTIDRSDGSLSLGGGVPAAPPSLRPMTVFGFLGTIDLLAGTYAVLATRRQLAGAFRGQNVYRLRGTKIVSCRPDFSSLTVLQRRDERLYLQMLKASLNEHGLFFSYDADLTTSTQQATKAGQERASLPLWRQADQRFVWNRHLLHAATMVKGLDPFILPIMQGSFRGLEVGAAGKALHVTLIARRSIDRIGTRMWRRGAGPDGSVANFVETEQVVQVDGSTASHVQVRGSIPIMWEQIVDLTYKPKMKTIISPNSGQTVPQHFRQLSRSYGSVLALDLINQKGGESVLGTAYARAMHEINDPSVRYVAFDFHHECGSSHFENLEKLFRQVAAVLDDFGYFLSDPRGRVLREQTGVVRSNCIDCLDRTNVTQSTIARKALESQLRAMGVFAGSEVIAQHPEFDTGYKIMWADHGDDISIEYSGTGALKGDFVRFGKRSNHGLLLDGRHSLFRYYFNNFADGFRQDSLNLVTGHYVVNSSAPSPFQRGLAQFASLPAVLLLLVAGLYYTVASLARAMETPQRFGVALGWGGVSSFIIWVLRKFGRLFCSRPMLPVR